MKYTIIAGLFFATLAGGSWAQPAPTLSASNNRTFAKLLPNFMDLFMAAELIFADTAQRSKHAGITNDPRCTRGDETLHKLLQDAITQLTIVQRQVEQRPIYPTESDNKRKAAIKLVENTYSGKITELEQTQARLPPAGKTVCKIEVQSGDPAA